MRLSRTRTRSQNPSAPMTSEDVSQVRPLPADLPEELIRQRAYEIWQRRGCPMGQDGTQDWHAARFELQQERLGWAAPRSSDRDRMFDGESEDTLNDRP